jgi:hypothetical protein
MKTLFTKTQIRNISTQALLKLEGGAEGWNGQFNQASRSRNRLNCVMELERLLASIEKKKDSTKVCFPSLFNLYWADSDWIAHGKGFEGKRPKVKKTISKKDIIYTISDHTGLTQVYTSEIISSLDKIICNRISACGAKMEKFDLFGLGTLVVEAGKLSFTSTSQTVSRNPSEYIKGIKIKPGEGFTREKGGNLRELTLEMCSAILKKIKSRTPKLRGRVAGFDADPFHVPSGVTSLDAKALSALSKHKGFLGLDPIKSMDCEGARALSAYRGCTYEVEGKGGWPIMRRCGFTLGGITKISEEVAAKLSKFDDAEPSWLTDLNICWPGEYRSDEILHDFSGLTSISPKALRSLAKLQGHLDLSGLESFTVEHATALKGHKGGVRLKGVKSISVTVAAELAKIRPGDYQDVNTTGWLYSAALIDLSGMKNLDIKACSALTHFKGSLRLGHFEILTANLAEVLKDHKHFLYLTFSSHEQAAKEILSDRRDFKWGNSQTVG